MALALCAACGVGPPAPVTQVDAAAVEVTDVVDGDTIRVRVADGPRERLRLIGIDAPERGECGADAATALLADLLRDATVRLESDVSDRDRFGRLLRYVHADGQHVNAALVEAGVAVARRYEPDTARAVELESAQDRAIAASAGLWAPAGCTA